MGQVDENIAINLRRIRRMRNMSLDMVAELTGVSKSMLGQIERGESNPTIGTISRIVEGIKVSYEDLLYRRDNSAEIIAKENLPIYRQKENEYSVKLLLPYDKQRAFEALNCEIRPGGVYQAPLTEESSMGLLTVLQGCLSVHMEDQVFEVTSKEVFRFSMDRECTYSNQGTETVIFEIILSNRTA